MLFVTYVRNVNMFIIYTHLMLLFYKVTYYISLGKIVYF